MIAVDGVGQREIGAFERAPLPLGVEPDRIALRQRHRRRYRQLRACRSEIVPVVAAQDQRAEGVPDRKRVRVWVDGGEPPVAREPDAGRARLAQHARLEIWLAICSGNVSGAVEAQATEIELATSPEPQPLDPIIACQSPAWRPRVKLPRGIGEVAKPACQFH